MWYIHNSFHIHIILFSESLWIEYTVSRTEVTCDMWPIRSVTLKCILHSHWNWFYESSVLCSAHLTYVFNRINHYTPEGTRESHPNVHDLQSKTRLAESWMSQIIDTRMEFPCPFRSVVIDYFSLGPLFSTNKSILIKEWVPFFCVHGKWTWVRHVTNPVNREAVLGRFVTASPKFISNEHRKIRHSFLIFTISSDKKTLF